MKKPEIPQETIMRGLTRIRLGMKEDPEVGDPDKVVEIVTGVENPNPLGQPDGNNQKTWFYNGVPRRTGRIKDDGDLRIEVGGMPIEVKPKEVVIGRKDIIFQR